MATVAQGGSVDVGRVISRAFAAVRRNAPGFVALSLLLAGAPSVALEYVIAWDELAADPDDFGMLIAASIGALLLNLFSLYVLQAALVRAVILDLDGRPPDLGGSLVRAVSLVLPLLGLTLVSGLAMMIGFMLLVVPGIFLLVIWSVSVPVMVEERLGVFSSLSRSAELTLGSRWPVFGLLVLVYVLAIVLAVVAGLYSSDAYADPLGYGLRSGAVAAVNGLVGAAVYASLYVELRTVKEGGTYEGLAAIFE